MLERKSASKSMVYTDRDPMPMFSNSCTQDRISPLSTQTREQDAMRLGELKERVGRGVRAQGRGGINHRGRNVVMKQSRSQRRKA